jgi:hypothetical protein
MADADTDTGTTTPTPGLGGLDPETLKQLMQLQQTMSTLGSQAAQTPTVTGPPVDRSFTSLLGEALGGGAQPGVLTPAQEEAAGRGALLNFGMQMLAGSGYSPVRRTLGEVFAQGLSGAGQAMQGAQVSNINLQQKQQELALERMKAMEPLLNTALALQKLKAGAGMPNYLTGSGAPGAPGARATPGGPGGDIAKAILGAGGDPYDAWVAGREGVGTNPASGAGGYGQFLPSTWQGFVKANPDLFKGMTPEQVLAARSDPTMAAKGMAWLRQQNSETLSAAGVPVTGQTLGISHYLGAGATSKLWSAPDSDPVSKYVSEAAVKANPELGSMTVGQMKQRYASAPNPGGGTTTATATPAPQAPSKADTGTKTEGGVQIGGEAPPPPGTGAGGAVTGIGAALNPNAPATATTLPVPPVPPANLPPVLGKGGAFHGARAEVTPADAAMAGVLQAQATPVVKGTGQEAGPSSAVATLAAPPAGGAAPAPAGAVTFGAPPPPSQVDYGGGKFTTPSPSGQPVTPPAAPGATTTPPAVPAPQPGTQQPTDKSDEERTWEEFQTAHMPKPAPEEVATWTRQPPQEAVDALRQEMKTAAQGVTSARAFYGPGSKEEAQQQERFTAAATALGNLQQQTDKANAEALANWKAKQLEVLRPLYSDAQGRKQAITLEQVKSGTHLTEAQAAADIDIAKNDLTSRTAEAQKAGRIIPILEQMRSQLGNLPQGALGALLAHYDTTGDITGMLAKMGVVDPSKATAAQILIAARNYLSIETKPAATGSLRLPEMDKLQSFTPGQLQTPQAQQEMAARLIAYQKRIQDERDFASSYFGRTDPNTGKRIYDNRDLDRAMNAPVKYDSNGVVTGGGLGPVVPEPPPLSAPDAEHQAYKNYLRRNVAPGMPYQTWAPKTDSNGQPVRDSQGRLVPERVTRVQGYD